MKMKIDCQDLKRPDVKSSLGPKEGGPVGEARPSSLAATSAIERSDVYKLYNR